MNKTLDICTHLNVTIPLHCANEAELRAALCRAPDYRVPILQYDALSAPGDIAPAILSSFCPHVDGEWNKISNAVQHLLDAAPFEDGASEDDAARLHGAFIFDMFRIFTSTLPPNLGFSVHRNQTEPSAASTTERLRPDTSARTFHGVLVFKGEEKSKSTYEALMMSRRELFAKIASWNPVHMGAIPFLLCYGAAGALVQFYCVRPTVGRGYAMHDVSDVLDLNTTQGRLQLSLISINCFRVMVAMQAAAPAPGAHGWNDQVVRPSGLRLIFAGDYVEKIYSRESLAHATTGVDFDAFINLLNQLHDNPPRHLEHPAAVGMNCLRGKHPIKIFRQSIRVCMVPCGFSVRPTTIPEMQSTIRCVLLGLRALHALGWVHGDVRWPNIVRIAADNWCLIDLNHARKLELDVAARKAHDFQAVAMLFNVEAAPLAASPDAVALRRELTEASDATDIEILLGHAWFH